MLQNPPRPPPWEPDQRTIERAHVTSLMDSVGVDSYEDLHRWSVTDPDAFWEEVLSDLDIQFDTPPTSVRGSDDPLQPDWLPDALFNIVSSCLDHDHEAPAIVAGGRDGCREVISVGDVKARVAAFAAGFSAAGFTTGDRVAIMMPMTPEAVVAYLGVVASGGVVVGIADSFAPDEIAVRLGVCDVVAVVTVADTVRLGRTLPMYDKCVEADAPMCIVVGDVDLRPQDVAWDRFLVNDAPYSVVPMPAGAHINVLFSSGTTGEPKAIPWTQTTAIKAAMDGRYHHDIHRGDVVAWPTNLGWMMGPWLVFAALLNRATIALYDDAPTTPGFVRFVADAGVTMLGMVPSIVAAWRRDGVLESGMWPSVRVLASTGEASSEDDSAWIMETAGNVPMIEYCGGTEIGGAYITGTVVQPAVASRFTTPTLGLDIVLIGDDGEPADEGEIFLVPPSMGLSEELINGDHDAVYYRDTPPWHRKLRRHGDRLARDSSGLYRALGRADDTMNLSGIKVSSVDLEAAIEGAAGVVDVAAVAVPPPEGGPEHLIVFAVVQEGIGADALRDEMQMRVRTTLNPLFKIHSVVLKDELPRTASHKLMRRSLRAEYLSCE